MSTNKNIYEPKKRAKKKRKCYRSSRCSHKSMTQNRSTPVQQITQADLQAKSLSQQIQICGANSETLLRSIRWCAGDKKVHQHNNIGYNDLPPIACRRPHIIFTSWKKVLYRTKLFIGFNVREIRDCQKSRKVKPTKSCYMPENNTEDV